MAYDGGNFNARGSLRDRAKGQQFWDYDAGTDLLATVAADDFFLTEFQRLEVDDIIQISTLGGAYNFKVLVSSAATVTLEMAQSVQSVTDTAATDTIARTTEYTTTGAATTTLIDGAIGQLKRCILIVDVGNQVLTPDTGHGYTTITFADAGDSVDLEFRALGWTVIGQGGLGTGPVVA